MSDGELSLAPTLSSIHSDEMSRMLDAITETIMHSSSIKENAPTDKPSQVQNIVIMNALPGLEFNQGMQRLGRSRVACVESDCENICYGYITRCRECACRMALSPLLGRIVTRDDERWMKKIGRIRKHMENINTLFDWASGEWTDYLWKVGVEVYYEQYGMKKPRIYTATLPPV